MAVAMAMATVVVVHIEYTVIYRPNRIQSFISDLYIESIYHFYSVCVRECVCVWGGIGNAVPSQTVSYSSSKRFSHAVLWNFMKFSGLECI